MRLPPGFTGFHSVDEASASTVDPAVLRSICYAVARILGGEISSFEVAEVTPNFHTATIVWGFGPTRVSLLCNRNVPLIALSKPRHGYELEWVDSVEFAEALGRVSDWQLLSKQQLETVVDEALLNVMDGVDRRTIETARRSRWFGPARTVGDVAFHFWD